MEAVSQWPMTWVNWLLGNEQDVVVGPFVRAARPRLRRCFSQCTQLPRRRARLRVEDWGLQQGVP